MINIRAAFLIAALLLAPTIYAGEARVSWTAPTQRVDGTALDNLAGYRVLWGTASRDYIQSAVVTVPTTTYTVTDLPEGTHYFAVTAFDADGLESAYSAEVSKVIQGTTVPPIPPDGLVVIAETAYALVQTLDRIALVAVGTVPAGTACDPDQYVRDSNGRDGFVVPKDAVTWAGSVRAEVVVAACQ